MTSRSILITGASSGIGLASARMLEGPSARPREHELSLLTDTLVRHLHSD